MALNPKLLEILACPEDKGPLFYVEAENTLYNPRLTRRYVVRDGIPVMLIDEAETVSAEEHARITADLRARGVYSIGRYGGWTYCSIEDNIVEARALVEALPA